MQTYSFTCTCGHVMTADAETRAEAVTHLKDQMSADAIAAHFTEKHEEETALSVEEIHSAIETGVTPKDDEAPEATPTV